MPFFLGHKRKRVSDHEGALESLIRMIERSENQACEREERMRRLELEMEKNMREREERREMQMFSMFYSFMQQLSGNMPGPSHSFQYGNMPGPSHTFQFGYQTPPHFTPPTPDSAPNEPLSHPPHHND